MISFSVFGVPQGKGRARFFRRGNFVGTFTPDKTAQAEQTLAARAMAYRPDEPLPCPLRLRVRFVMPIPQSWSRKRKEAAAGSPHVAKPDLDNLVKLLKDALNGVFWIDDKQVCELVAEKQYGEVPATHIAIEEVSIR